MRRFHSQRRAVALILTAALCLVVLPGPDAHGAENAARSFTSDWECEETALVFYVDEAGRPPC